MRRTAALLALAARLSPNNNDNRLRPWRCSHDAVDILCHALSPAILFLAPPLTLAMTTPADNVRYRGTTFSVTVSRAALSYTSACGNVINGDELVRHRSAFIFAHVNPSCINNASTSTFDHSLHHRTGLQDRTFDIM